MLSMARGLRQRKRRAWLGTLILLGSGAILQLIRGVEPVHTAVALLLAASLVVTRRHFIGVPDPGSRQSLPLVSAGLFGGAVLAGVIAVVADGRELVAPWTVSEVLRQALLGLIGVPGPLRFVNTDAATESHVLLFGLGLVAAGALVAAMLHSPGRGEPATENDRDRVRALLANHGDADSLGYFATRDDKAYIFSASGKAATAYTVSGGVCLASGDPIGDVEAWPGAIQAWLARSAARAWIPGVLGASETGAEAYRRSGLDAVEIGDEAIVEVAEFSLDGRSMRTVRQAVSRASRAGYQVSIDRVGDVDVRQAAELREHTDRWRDGGFERGFSMALSRLAAPTDPDCVIVQTRSPTGALVIVLQFVPWGRNGLSLDLVRRQPDLDNGVMELTVTELLTAARRRGVTRVSLNFAVFRSALARGERIGAGPFLRLWVRVLLLASRWWQIASLYRANAKFRPHWEPRFLCFPLVRDLGPIVLAALRVEGLLPTLRRYRRPSSPRSALPMRPSKPTGSDTP
jgi:lysyl-tRNA synthetase class 2